MDHQLLPGDCLNFSSSNLFDKCIRLTGCVSLPTHLRAPVSLHFSMMQLMIFFSAPQQVADLPSHGRSWHHPGKEDRQVGHEGNGSVQYSFVNLHIVCSAQTQALSTLMMSECQLRTSLEKRVGVAETTRKSILKICRFGIHLPDASVPRGKVQQLHPLHGKHFTNFYSRMAAAAITLSGMTLCIDQTIAYTRYMQLLLTLLYILIKGRGRYLVPLSWITSTVTSAWPNSSLRLVKTLIQY